MPWVCCGNFSGLPAPLRGADQSRNLKILLPIGAGIQAFLEKAWTQESQGVPPAPPGIKPLAGARSSLWDRAATERSLFLSQPHVRALIWRLSFGRIFFAGFFPDPVPLSTNPRLPARPAGGRALSQVGHRAAGQDTKKRDTPKDIPNQSGGVQRGETLPLVFFPPFLT